MRNTVTQFTSLIALLAVGSGTALAQYGGGSMGGSTGSTGIYTAPKGGYGGSGAAIGIGLGAAAAGGGFAYWKLHNRPTVIGCIRHSDRGNTLFNEKDGKLYNLLPESEVTFKPGERVALKGKKIEDSGKYSFEARKLIKDYGACEVSSVASGGTQ